MDKGKRKTSEEPIFPICEGADNDYDDIDWGTVIGTFTVEEPVTGGRTAGGGTSRRHLYYAYVCPNERGEPHFHVFDKSGFHRDEMEKDGVHSCVGIARGAYFGHGPYSDYLGGETLAALDKFMGETRPEHCSDGGRTNFEHTIREWNDNNVVKLDPVHTRKPDYAAMARAEPAGKSPFEVATVGWPVFDGVRYRLSVDGQRAGECPVPHIHIDRADDLGRKRFSFEISLVDLLATGEPALIRQKDAEAGIDRTGKADCGWDGYERLRDDILAYLESGPDDTAPRDSRSNLESLVILWNKERGSNPDLLTAYIKEHGINVAGRYKGYFPKPAERWGVRVVLYPDVGDPVPPNDIPGLLASDPDRGLFELERATFDPSMPSKTVRKILTDAFDDARITPDTKARLLWRYNRVPDFLDAVLADLEGDIPFPLLDSGAGCRWYCEREMPGYETVRCSNPVFPFTAQWPPLGSQAAKKHLGHPVLEDEFAGDRKDFEPIVLEAIDADEPMRLLMALSVAGRQVDLRLIYLLIRDRKMRILDRLMEIDEATQRWLDPRRMLFYACANWPRTELIPYVRRAERRNPGLVASCTDVFGRNLLWYMSANFRPEVDFFFKEEDAEKLLIKLGADPDAPTKWGVSWRQMKCARDSEGWGLLLMIDKWMVPCSGRIEMREDFNKEVDGDEHLIWIRQNPRLDMRWSFPKSRYPAIRSWCHLLHDVDSQTGRDKGEKIGIVFWNERDRIEVEAVFRRGLDRLFHFENVERRPLDKTR